MLGEWGNRVTQPKYQLWVNSTFTAEPLLTNFLLNELTTHTTNIKDLRNDAAHSEAHTWAEAAYMRESLLTKEDQHQKTLLEWLLKIVYS